MTNGCNDVDSRCINPNHARLAGEMNLAPTSTSTIFPIRESFQPETVIGVTEQTKNIAGGNDMTGRERVYRVRS